MMLVMDRELMEEKKTNVGFTSGARGTVVGEDEAAAVRPVGHRDEERTAQVLVALDAVHGEVAVGAGLAQAAQTVLGDQRRHLACDKSFVVGLFVCFSLFHVARDTILGCD